MIDPEILNLLRERGREIFTMCEEHKIPFLFVFLDNDPKATSAHCEAYAQGTPAQYEAMLARFIMENEVRKHVSNPN